MKTKFQLDEFELRTDIEHRYRCDQLDQFSKDNRKYWSRSWGINNKSCLMEIEGFSLDLFVQDPMHVLLEGVVPQMLAFLLHWCIYQKKYFNLRWLNARIASYPYSYLQKSAKPEKIEKAHIDKGQIKQTSASMMTLCDIILFILTPKVPETDEKLKNFIRLLQITQIVLSPVCDVYTPRILGDLISTHHEEAIKQYGNSVITPKCHYMIHFPRQMKLFGPLRHHWAMRFEAKHSWSTSRKTKNFKNLPKTISTKHQKYMCHQMTDKFGRKHANFLYRGDIVKEGLPRSVTETMPEVAVEFGQLCGSDVAYCTECVQIHGHTYKPGCVLVLRYEEDEPVFGIVSHILVKDEYKCFVVDVQNTEYFDSALLAYALSSSGRKELVLHSKLASRWPLTKKHFRGLTHVVNKYSHVIEYLD